eukprot:m.1474 g.1474  ORF g.1474 m.1474 type:complete len:124 (+) comp307_c0_seq1:471-842(+)
MGSCRQRPITTTLAQPRETKSTLTGDDTVSVVITNTTTMSTPSTAPPAIDAVIDNNGSHDVSAAPLDTALTTASSVDADIDITTAVSTATCTEEPEAVATIEWPVVRVSVGSHQKVAYHPSTM